MERSYYALDARDLKEVMIGGLTRSVCDRVVNAKRCAIDCIFQGELGFGVVFRWMVVRGGGGELTGTALCNQPAQITGTEAEPQQIVAQRLLSCLQYPVP